MQYLTVEELIQFMASVDARSAAGQQCYKAVSDHFKGIAKEFEKYRRSIAADAPQTQTKTIAAKGTVPSKHNLKS